MSDEDSRREKLEEEAASWMWRYDRGLSAEEQDDFFDWLAEAPENSEFFKRNRKNWKRLDNLANWLPEHSDKPNPDLLAPTVKPNLMKFGYIVLSVAALVALSLFVLQLNRDANSSSMELSQAVALENRTALEDGSVVKLKDDAKITVLYTENERRVRLEKGEAFFIVAKNLSRPFVVEVKGVDVSALGTAFNIRLDSRSFEVLVSEGVVEVDSSYQHYDARVSRSLTNAPRLEASQRAVVSLVQEEDTPEIATLTQGEIHRVLAWQHGLMTFNSRALSEIAYELNHFNETQMIVLDDELAQTRFSGSFRSDNMEGFVRLLEVAFGAKAEWRGDFEILLSKKVD